MQQALNRTISIGLIVTTGLMLWKALVCISGSESPIIIVVLSDSMEGFSRGDILFLCMNKEPIRAGEVVVFNIDASVFSVQPLQFSELAYKLVINLGGRVVTIPVVHRVIKLRTGDDAGDEATFVYRDTNADDDIALYAPGERWLHPKHILGRAVGFLPHVGWVAIVMTENPLKKVCKSSFVDSIQIFLFSLHSMYRSP